MRDRGGGRALVSDKIGGAPSAGFSRSVFAADFSRDVFSEHEAGVTELARKG
jgi:hypothetical protein